MCLLLRLVLRYKSARYTARTPVELVQYDLNMTSGELDLSFSAAVSVSTLDPKEITLQSAQGTATSIKSYPLTGGSTASTNGASVVVQITDFDLNEIKADRTLATSSSTTFMAMGAGALKTVFDVAVLAIIPDVARTVTSYTADNVPPVLNNFTIALNWDRSRLHSAKRLTC